MAKKGDPNVLRLVVSFLRSYTRMTQTAFADAAGVAQSDISRYQAGRQTPPEEALRRMAAVAGVPWPVVIHVRRFYAAVLSVVARWSAVQPGGPPLDAASVERALLAVTPYLLADAAAEPERPTPEAECREAAEIWADLERFPLPQRRRLIELSLHASRSWALAERICHGSEEAAARNAAEALELADLALSIAWRVPGEESWRSRMEGYCWAYVANARRADNDLAGADEAFARAWDLWRRGAEADPGLPPEWRLLNLEASLRQAQHRFPEALELLDRAKAASEDDPVAAARILLKKEHVFE
ncbi:MAG TPA: helix-turn-helix transcriptional regulator [Thermoanaerobaculia bacterium]